MNKNQITENHELPDDENPEFLFNSTFTSILLNIANGSIDPVELAYKELANRGLDLNGDFIGANAEEYWKKRIALHRTRTYSK